MTGEPWEFSYVGPLGARKRVSKRTAAIRRRRRRGGTWAHPDTTQARIGEVMGLMRAGAWDGNRSAREAATRWGVSTSRAQQLAAEAARRVRDEKGPVT